MALTSETSSVHYIGTGSLATYAYPFVIFKAADLRVHRLLSGSSVPTLLLLGIDYTVSGVGDEGGGEITLVGGNLASGAALTIRRAPALTQDTDFRNQGAFFAETHEDAFDRGVMIDQSLRFDLDRTIRFPDTVDTTGVDATLPAPVAGKLIGWDLSGTALVLYETTSITIGVPDDGTVTSDKIAANAVITTKIADDAVTYAKIQDVTATDRVLGRQTAGAGAIEEIICTAAGRALLDDANAAAQRATLGLGTAALVNIGTASGNVPLIGTISATAALAGLVELATDAETKTATDTSRVAPVSAMNHHPGVCKAWVSFTGTGTVAIDGSHNVTSITDDGVGQYTVNISTAFASDVHARIAMGQNSATNKPILSVNSAALSASSTKLLVDNNAGSNFDPPQVWFAAFGHQS